MSSLGKLSLTLRVNKSSDTGMEPCGRLLHLSIPSSATSQCCTPREQAALSWCCNPCLAAMVRITVSKVFLPSVHHRVSVCLLQQQTWLPASGWLRRSYSKVWGQKVQAGVWGRWEKGSWAGRSCWGHSALSGGCRMWLLQQRSGSCGVALSEPYSFIPSCGAATVPRPGKMQWTQMDLLKEAVFAL